MPWVPHTNGWAGELELPEWTNRYPVLRQLEEENRLLWYDLSTVTTDRKHGSYPVVRASYFSAEAAIHLLAMCGIKKIRSLGVDGGTAYSGDFEDLNETTRLIGGQSSYDLQFAGFERTVSEFGIDYAPLVRTRETACVALPVSPIASPPEVIWRP
jgi:hypothetical protein